MKTDLYSQEAQLAPRTHGNRLVTRYITAKLSETKEKSIWKAQEKLSAQFCVKVSSPGPTAAVQKPRSQKAVGWHIHSAERESRQPRALYTVKLFL